MVGPPLPPEMIPTGPKVPNFRGKTKRQVMEESSALGMRVEIAGTGIARRQEPQPGHSSPPGRKSEGSVRPMNSLLFAGLSQPRPRSLSSGGALFSTGN